jgi:membrane-bound ClpP family serine protease
MNLLERMILLVRVAIRGRREKMLLCSDGIIGVTGVAQTLIDPYGTVFVRGELWPAQSLSAIAPGEKVLVAGLNGATLDVCSYKSSRATTAIGDQLISGQKTLME